MPVEIKELVIRAVAEPSSGSGSAGSCGEGVEGVGGAEGNGNATVEACVREVLRIMKRSKER